VDRVFLDANVLFSAAYKDAAPLAALWQIPGCRLLTSAYAVEEARRNLASPELRRAAGIEGRAYVVIEQSATRIAWGTRIFLAGMGRDARPAGHGRGNGYICVNRVAVGSRPRGRIGWAKGGCALGYLPCAFRPDFRPAGPTF
jgi:hypothetical protein